MKTNRAAGLLVLAVQVMILIPAPALTRAQSQALQMTPPSASSGTQRDPYADAFAGLTYTENQKEAIRKIRQDIASRKAAVLKEDKLTQDQKDAMLSGYTRMEYILIFKALTPDQKKQVSARIRDLRAQDQNSQKTMAPK